MVTRATEEAAEVSRDPKALLAVLGGGEVAKAIYSIKDHVSMGAEYAAPVAFLGEASERLNAQNEVLAVRARLLEKYPGAALPALNLSLIKTSGDAVVAAASLEKAAEDFAAGKEGTINNAHLAESREEKLHRLVETIGKLNEQISDDLEELYKSGKISRDVYESLRKVREHADQYPVGSKEWVSAQKDYAVQTRATLEPIHDEAVRTGDTHTADATARTIDATRASQAAADDFWGTLTAPQSDLSQVRAEQGHEVSNAMSGDLPSPAPNLATAANSKGNGVSALS